MPAIEVTGITPAVGDDPADETSPLAEPLLTGEGDVTVVCETDELLAPLLDDLFRS